MPNMTDEYNAVIALVRHPNFSIRFLAASLHWERPGDRKPDHVRVHLALVQAAERGLVTHSGSYKGWRVTGRGSEVVANLPGENS